MPPFPPPVIATVVAGLLLALAVVAPGSAAAGDAATRDVATGDVAAGEQVFRMMCAPCHSAEPGVEKTGPSLFGVYGRTAGSTEFPRYKGLAGAAFAWDASNLNAYLDDPKAFVVAHTSNWTTAMTFALKDARQREDVVAYLQSLRE